MTAELSALILAAGRGTRMGQTKQLLDLAGLPILERVIRNVLSHPFTEIVTVVGFEADEIKARIRIEDERFRWIVNPHYAKGQSTSLLKGLKDCRNPSIVIFLGDEPFVKEATVQHVIASGRATHAHTHEPFVLRPTFENIPGHPVFLGNVRSAAFSHLSGDRGAKCILRQMARRYLIPVTDPGVVLDIDTPADYENAKKRWARLH